MPAPLYLALIHYPILNKHGETVTTSVTNFDLHDLARTGRTYGVKRVFIVTPNEKQLGMVRYIWDYWHDGFGGEYNPDRKEAFEVLEGVENIDAACLTIKNLDGKSPSLIATSARRTPSSITYEDLRERRQRDGTPLMLCFGTGFGMTPDFIQSCEACLEPIEGAGDFNHLPVRAAVAIILDRLRLKDF